MERQEIEKLKSEVKSFGFSTGEYVALRKIYRNRVGSDVNEEEFIKAVAEFINACPREA